MVEHEEVANKEKNSSNNATHPTKEGGSWSLKKTLTGKEIMSQAIMFLIAGYETTATALEFLAYNLAMNQDVQNKLIEEVDNVIDQNVH
jgi:cytochrome P450